METILIRSVLLVSFLDKKVKFKTGRKFFIYKMTLLMMIKY